VGGEFDSFDSFDCRVLNKYNRKSSRTKILSSFYFSILALFFIIKNRPKFDKYLFVSNPPVLLMFLPFLRINYSILIYDLYPDSLVSSKLLTNTSTPLFRFLHSVFFFSYSRAEFVFCISKFAMTRIGSDVKYTSTVEKVIYSPLWFNADAVFKKKGLAISKSVSSLPIRGKFVITYSGNMGYSHPIEDLVLASDYFDSDSVVFLIIGAGEKMPSIRAMSKTRENVICLDYLDQVDFSYILANSDIGVSCLDSSFSNVSLPSKTFNLLANGIPILAITERSSELSKLVLFHNSGIVVDPGNPDMIFKRLQPAIHSLEIYERMCVNAKKASQSFAPENVNIITNHLVNA